MAQKFNWYFYPFLLFWNQYILCDCSPLIGPNTRQAGEREFPFVVSISYDNFDNRKDNEVYHNCGGALISKKCVLTSAHCMSQVDELTDITVYVGSNDLRKAKPFKVASWKPYNEWCGAKNHTGYTENDIAIIKLKKEVNSDIELGIITSHKNTDFFGKNATIAGWGETSDGKNSRYLMTADLNILSKEKCIDSMIKAGVYTKEEISPSIFLCTDSPLHVALGKADSGGPLIVNGNEIIGINDSISPTGKENPKEMNIHIGVDIYRDDIKNQIEKKSILPWKHNC